MRPIAAKAAVVVAVAALAVLLAGSLVTASAQVAAVGGLRLVLSDVSPRVVTADGPTVLNVTGMLTNDGPTPVSDLVVRVQRGDPLGTEGQVRDALDGEAATDAVAPQFVPLTDVLEPGGRVPVRLSVPLRGAPQTGLALSTTGVHELLVNVNGTPQDGARARLAAVRMLLPVLDLPGGDAGPRRADPTPLTVLYPIADVPHRLSTTPGAPVLLADDALVASFATTGRLGGLVTALAQHAPVGSAGRSAVCVALDPDLVETAALMSQGYQVVSPDGAITAGAGAEVAAQWLGRLRGAVRGGCVVALPYADADLVALERGGLTDAAARALGTGRQILSTLLQTPVLNDVAWPADGHADAATLDVLTANGVRSVLLSGDAVTGRVRSGVVPITGDRPLAALLTDPLLTRAATGPIASPTTPGRGAAALADSPAGDGGPLATQDLIGALGFRAAGRAPIVMAPPHQWATGGAGAQYLLDAVDALVDAGAVTPIDVPGTLAVPALAPVQPDPAVTGAEIPAAAIDTVATAARNLVDLRTAVVADARVGISADELFAPLDLGIARAASAAYRRRPDAAQAAAAAELSRVDAVRNSIRVLEPPSPYSLGTSDAPLPITIANALPVTVRVRIDVRGTPGLRVAPIEIQQVPPLGRRQVSVNAQVTRAGQFTVEAVVHTPGGGELGPPSRLRLRSTAYGTITGWLTAVAGGLLVVLAGRRIWRRARGESDRSAARVDPIQPDPAENPPPSPSGRPTPRVGPRAPPGAPADRPLVATAEEVAPRERLPPRFP